MPDRNLPIQFVAFIILLLSSLGVRAEEPLRVAADRPVDIEHIRLDLTVSIEQKQVAGTATIDFSPYRPIDQLKLDAAGHEVEAVDQLNGDAHGNQPLDYENTGESLLISFPETLPRGQQTRIRVRYRVRDPEAGLHFFQPTETEPGTPRMVWSQGEPVSNRHWFPCLDNPNERQTTELVVTVDSRYSVLSNGRLVSRTVSDDGRQTTFHWRQDAPHVAYLVTMVVSELEIVEQEWRGRPVLYYVPRGQTDLVEATFGRTREMLDFFSERFGIEYPWDKYAQVVVEQFTIGGMENTSATTLVDWVMHDDRALLTSSPDWLIAHEMGHQWWGDLVTCKDWTHLWLNEGFATYCEVLWAEHHLGRDEADYRLYDKSRSARSGSALKRPIVDRRYENPSQMFDARAYPKGGWVLHMLRRLVGDEEFFRALQRYGTVYAYQTAETADLRRIFSDLTGFSLERFFYDWTERPGHPVLDVKTSWDAEEELVEIAIKQTQEGEPFHFPLTIELVASDSPQTRQLTRYVTEKELTVLVPMAERPVAVRIDPEFSLLAEIREQKSRDWWTPQLNATTVAERVRAVEHFAESKQNGDRDLIAGVLNDDPFYGVRVEAAKALGESGGDIAREALITGLGAEDARVRSACATALGEFREDAAAVAALENVLQSGEPGYAVVAAALSSLGRIQDHPAVDVFQAALQADSHGEVIRQAALRSLARVESPAAFDLLLEWTRPGHHRDCRRAAIAAIAARFGRIEPSDQQQTAAIEALAGYLQTERPRIRRAAADALRDLGSTGTPALDVLDALARHDANLRVRTAARSAAEAIRSGDTSEGQVRDLRKELEELREQNRELTERLDRIEVH